ncbi:MAG: glycosyl transferase family A, partial [Leptolyngbyaceae cyanobacterium MO_188.B28]|nr:glycosyl transferase family A [Leptolyngbyaceae cyanobacterium MO_188.B28]
LPAAEDWDMWLRLAQDSEFVAVPSPQIFYRRTSSMSSNVVRQEQACLTVINRAFDNAPESLQPLRRQTLAQLYKYLIFKAIEGPPGRAKGWLAGKCLWRAIQYNPSLLRQHKVVLSVLMKIVAALFS